MTKFMVSGLREYLATCPHLAEGVIHIDYQGLTPTQYNIEVLDAPRVIKAYIDGTSLMQLQFRFSSVVYYGADVGLNLASRAFFEKFCRWLTLQNRRGALPLLGEAREALSVEAVTEGYLFESGEDTAKYQVDCRILYYERGEFE